MLTRDFAVAQAKSYDIIVVGGGIYGATMAWEAVSRGLSVALLEKKDFGHATSANSMKIVHGGVRYLKKLDFSSLRESSNERSALMRIAPHLVAPLKCLVPTQNSLTQHRWILKAALLLNNILSLNRNKGVDSARHILAAGVMDHADLVNKIPAFKDLVCTGAGYWYDAQAHNVERLVLSFVLSAAKEGATVLNYAVVERLVSAGGSVDGVIVRDHFGNGRRYKLRADTVVDCTGSWSKLYSEFNESANKPVFAKAVNLVIKKSFFPCTVGLKVKTNAGTTATNRQLFITPWRGQSIIGTWYFPVREGQTDACPSPLEFDICLRQANLIFPGTHIEPEDIVNVHSGLLPAESSIDKNGEPELKSKPSILDAGDHGGPQGLFCVSGVKLTTARRIAQQTIDFICRDSGTAIRKSNSDIRPLYGGDLGQIEAYYKAKRKTYQGRLEVNTIDRLIDNYGTNIELIMDYITRSPSFGQLVPGSSFLLRAELQFSIDHELVVTLSDLLLRRVNTGPCERPEKETIEFCADFLGQYLDWSESSKEKNIKLLLDSFSPSFLPD
ncbi:hypothetical protein MNBD_GAMMA16-665 [hydrothermal vent metagenome]|uniref:Glycerol-3-phosphate dehydrogenase n=1 Tax=hydrothermal vent metagenome TaxID=652676 RepID=A0A3B0ZQE4_9ZZZZ